MKDVDLTLLDDPLVAARVIEALSDNPEPPEPDFLPDYRPEYHEPPLGEMSVTLRHLYWLSVNAMQEHYEFPRNTDLRKRARLTRELFCREARKEFGLTVGGPGDVEVCKGWLLCLVAEVTDTNDDPTDSVEISYLVGLSDKPERRVVRATPSRLVSDMM